MIIQVVGTNGAGKSTVVRTVLAAGVITHENADGVFVTLPSVEGDVWVPGRYDDIATGGCDRFKDVTEIYEKIRLGLGSCDHVLWEGGTSHGGLNQTTGPEFAQAMGVYAVVLLTTPYGLCLDGINTRRAEIGRSPLRDDKEIRSNLKRAQNYAARMRDAGARIIRASRDEAPGRILELLRQAS